MNAKMNIKKICGILFLVIGANYSFAQTECKFFNDDEAISGQSLSTATPASVGFDSKLLAKVDKQINSDINRGFPGAALLIIKDGKVVKQTVYGHRLKYSLTSGKKMPTPDLMHCTTMFDLASNTKMYATNYAIMHLVYEGKLDIDKKVKYYLPDYTGCDANDECRDKRTIRDLLTHRAGYMPDPQFFDPDSIDKYGSGLYSQNRELTESIILTRLPFAGKKADKPVYSDVDYMLLGMVVEAITGETLDEYVNQTIYTPLGLKYTTFNPLEHGFTKAKCAATEISGNTRGGTVSFPNIRTKPLICQVHDEKAYYSMGGISGHAGLFSDLGDMAVLVDIMLNNGQYGNSLFWDKSVEDEFVKPLKVDDTYGLGWRMVGKEHSFKPFGQLATVGAFGHTGWTGTLTLIDRKNNMAIVLLTNKKHTKYKDNKFAGDSFATGQYYQIVDLIYQALNDN